MLITMSDKEIQRLAVLQDVRDHRITQVRAAEILNLSTRQITRLLQKLNQDGVSGMTHASRGQPGHRRHDDLLKSNVFPLFLNICWALDLPWRMRSSAACLT
jgi:hypothetical protein